MYAHTSRVLVKNDAPNMTLIWDPLVAATEVLQDVSETGIAIATVTITKAVAVAEVTTNKDTVPMSLIPP